MCYKVVFNIVLLVLIKTTTASTSPLTFPNGNEHPLNMHFQQFPTLKKSGNVDGKLDNYGVPTSSYELNDATKLTGIEQLLKLHGGIGPNMAEFGANNNQRDIKYIPKQSDKKPAGNHINADIGKEILSGKPIDSNSLVLGNGIPEWIMNLNNGRRPYGHGFIPMPHGFGQGYSVKNDGFNNNQYGFYINQPYHIGASNSKGEYGIGHHLEAGNSGYVHNVVSSVNKESEDMNRPSQVIKKEIINFGQDTKSSSQNINNLLHSGGNDKIFLEYLLKQMGTKLLTGNQVNNLSANNRALYLLYLQQVLNNMHDITQGGGMQHLLLQLIQNSSHNHGKTDNGKDSSIIDKISSREPNNQNVTDQNSYKKVHSENFAINSANKTTENIKKGKISKIVKIITIMNHNKEGSVSKENQSNDGSLGKKTIKTETIEKLDELKVSDEQKNGYLVDKSKVVEQGKVSGNNQSGEKKKCIKKGKFIVTIEKEENSGDATKGNVIISNEKGNIINKPVINVDQNLTIKQDEESKSKEENTKVIEDNVKQNNKDVEIIDSIYEKEKSGNNGLHATEDGWINSELNGTITSKGQQEESNEGNSATTATEVHIDKDKKVVDEKIIENDFREVQNIANENENQSEKLESLNEKKETVTEEAENEEKKIIDNKNSESQTSETLITEGSSKVSEIGGSISENGKKVEDKSKKEFITEGGNTEESNGNEENNAETNREELIKITHNKEEGKIEEGIKIEHNDKEEVFREKGNKEESKGEEENNAETKREELIKIDQDKDQDKIEEGIKIEDNDNEEVISEEENKEESNRKEENKEEINRKEENKEESNRKEENTAETNGNEIIKTDHVKEQDKNEEGITIKETNKEEVINEEANKEGSKREEESKEEANREEVIKAEDSHKEGGDREGGENREEGNREESNNEEEIKIEDNVDEENNSEAGNKDEVISEGENKEESNREEGNTAETNGEEVIKIDHAKEQDKIEESIKIEGPNQEEVVSEVGNEEESKSESESKKETNREEVIEAEDTHKEEGDSEGGENREEGNREQSNNEEEIKIEDNVKEENNNETGNKDEVISEEENKEESNREESNNEEGIKIEDNFKEEYNNGDGNKKESYGEEENKDEGNREEGNKEETNVEENQKKETDNEEENKNEVTKGKEKCQKEFPGLYVLTTIKPTKKDDHSTANKQIQSQNILKLKLDVKKPNNDIVLKHKSNEFSITVEVGKLSSDDKPLIKQVKEQKCEGKTKKYKNKRQNLWSWILNKKKIEKFSKLSKHENCHNKAPFKKHLGQIAVLDLDRVTKTPKKNEDKQIEYLIIKKKAGKSKKLITETRPHRKGKQQKLHKIKFFTVPDNKENFGNKFENVKYIIIDEDKQKVYEKRPNKFNFNKYTQKVNLKRLPELLKELLLERKQNDELMESSEDKHFDNQRYVLINKNDLTNNRNTLLNLIQENLDNEDDFGSRITSLNSPKFIKQKNIFNILSKYKKPNKNTAKYFLIEKSNLKNDNENIPENYYSYKIKSEEQLNNEANPLNYIILKENSIKPENVYKDLENKGQLIEDFSQDYKKYLSLIESSSIPENILEITENKHVSSPTNSLGEYIVISEKLDETEIS
ncbi:hypothetical protein O3M35_000411 [Rhynocoris fuscipes]|uniref:Uncharacterized protein n=1 Tax=Rhynocoris fuscipes TaxID=488301 RepID=A0AAW1DLB1_9HEMI